MGCYVLTNTHDSIVYKTMYNILVLMVGEVGGGQLKDMGSSPSLTSLQDFILVQPSLLITPLGPPLGPPFNGTF